MLQRVARLLRMQPPVVTDRGLLFASGATVPTDGADGYQVGCIFQHTDGGAETALYVNEGSVTSCAFKALKSPETSELDDLADVGTIAYSTGSLLVADGDSYEEVALSGPFNLVASGLLSMDSATVAAAGSDQTDAAAVADGYTLATGADGTKGVKLPAAAAGGFCIVKNNAASALNLYPNTDDKIDGGSANAAVTVDAYSAAVLVAYDATDWYTVARSYITTTTTVGHALVDLRQDAAMKDALPDTPDATTLGLADAAGSAVVGTTTNDTGTASASETASFDFVVPKDYVANEDLTCRLKALVSAAREVAQTVDVVAKLVKEGALDATDLCLTAAQDLTTSEADYDFTIDGDASGDELTPGSVVHVQVTLATDDTGGGTDGYPQLNTVQMRVPCYR